MFITHIDFLLKHLIVLPEECTEEANHVDNGKTSQFMRRGQQQLPSIMTHVSLTNRSVECQCSDLYLSMLSMTHIEFGREAVQRAILLQ